MSLCIEIHATVYASGISMSLCIELQDHVSSSSAYVSRSNISSAVWDSNDNPSIVIINFTPKKVCDMCITFE